MMQMFMYVLKSRKESFALILVCIFMIAFMGCKSKNSTQNVEEIIEEEIVVYSENELFDEFFETMDFSVITDKIGCFISSKNINYDRYSYTFETPESLRRYMTIEKRYSIAFCQMKDAKDKGMVILFKHKFYNEEHPDSYDLVLVDAIHIECGEGQSVFEDYLRSGYNPKDDTCRVDEKRYGIVIYDEMEFLPRGVFFPLNYILSVTEDKLILEVPEDDTYFLYYMTRFDGV